METSCPKDTIRFYPMDGLQDLCENPGNYNFLEAQLPVSHLDTGIHYRNVFCAYCWNVSPIQQTPWQLEIHCHKKLVVTDKDILHKVKSEKCNIFYRPLFLFQYYNLCYFPSYTIYKCNQSGLWKETHEMIEWACNKYFDPFNGTYKNYFCYLCNVDFVPPNDSWYCPDASSEIGTKRAPNVARFELTSWRSVLYQELICDTATEFSDYKMVRYMYNTFPLYVHVPLSHEQLNSSYIYNWLFYNVLFKIASIIYRFVSKIIYPYKVAK